MHLCQIEHKANGTGGMTTKFEAARIATQHGVAMFIANGRQDNVLQKALSGQAGTAFV